MVRRHLATGSRARLKGTWFDGLFMLAWKSSMDMKFLGWSLGRVDLT